eukprot:tig00000789_g4144.t1
MNSKKAGGLVLTLVFGLFVLSSAERPPAANGANDASEIERIAARVQAESFALFAAEAARAVLSGASRGSLNIPPAALEAAANGEAPAAPALAGDKLHEVCMSMRVIWDLMCGTRERRHGHPRTCETLDMIDDVINCGLQRDIAPTQSEAELQDDRLDAVCALFDTLRDTMQCGTRHEGHPHACKALTMAEDVLSCNARRQALQLAMAAVPEPAIPAEAEPIAPDMDPDQHKKLCEAVKILWFLECGTRGERLAHEQLCNTLDMVDTVADCSARELTLPVVRETVRTDRVDEICSLLEVISGQMDCNAADDADEDADVTRGREERGGHGVHRRHSEGHRRHHGRHRRCHHERGRHDRGEHRGAAAQRPAGACEVLEISKRVLDCRARLAGPPLPAAEEFSCCTAACGGDRCDRCCAASLKARPASIPAAASPRPSEVPAQPVCTCSNGIVAACGCSAV